MFHAPRFWWHAIPSMMQAKSSPGNLKAEAKTIHGVHHTLTVWTDEAAMRAYLVTGAHLKAMKIFKSVAEGKVIGYLAESAPDWNDIPQIWNEKGRQV